MAVLTVQSYLNNSKWIERMEEGFQQFDYDNNGFLSRENWLKPIENLKNAIPDRPGMVAKVQTAIEEFLDVFGLVEGVKVDKKQFIEITAVHSLAEAERYRKGELTYVEKINHALFDAADRDSTGYLSLDEYKVASIAFNFDEEAAQFCFDMLDKDKAGKIDKKAFADADVKFWCILDLDDD